VADQPELVEHLRIRRVVFVSEQRLFAEDDRDSYDDAAGTVHVLGFVDGVPAGAVRLYPLGASGRWKGDRLAVLPEYRHAGIGGPLVRHAVATAGALGGARMLAQIQDRNTTFFRRLGWSPLGEPADHLGVPHRWMAIELR
jgi:putative N-acetyltransferase (TIGR04045 family)